jgi:hypothetical protein
MYIARVLIPLFFCNAILDENSLNENKQHWKTYIEQCCLTAALNLYSKYKYVSDKKENHFCTLLTIKKLHPNSQTFSTACSEILLFQNKQYKNSEKSIPVQTSYTITNTLQNRNYTMLSCNLLCNECTFSTVPHACVLHCQHKLIHLASRPQMHPVVPKMFFY